MRHFRKGLELVPKRTRETEELKRTYSSGILPPIYREFLHEYQLGKWSIGNLLELENEKIVLTSISLYTSENTPLKGYHSTMDPLFEADKVQQEIEKHSNKTEKWHQKGFIQIGILHWSDLLLLGVEEHNMDEIWRYGQGHGELMNRLESNVFDLLNKLTEAWDEENLEVYKIDVSRLNKSADGTWVLV